MQITKETNRLKKLVAEYNIRTSPDTEISMEMAIDPQNLLCSSKSLTMKQKRHYSGIFEESQK